VKISSQACSFRSHFTTRRYTSRGTSAMGGKRKLNEMTIKPPKSQPGASHIQVEDENLVKMPTIMTLTGQAGKGKTTAAVSFLKKMKDNGLCDRIFLVTPTAGSNSQLWKEMELPVAEEDTWHPDSPNVVSQIREKIDDERHQYEEYQKELERYKQMIKQFKGLQHVTQKAKMDAFKFVKMRQGQPDVMKPQHKWNGKIPVLWMLMDDCQGNRIFKPNSGLSNMAIEHRHQGQFKDGGAVGLSLMVNLQNFKDRSDGCPRPVRSNSRQYCLFFTRDQKEREAVAEEAGGVTDANTLLQKWDEATAPLSPNFLFVDKNPINEQWIFRKNFDEPLDPPPEIRNKD